MDSTENGKLLIKCLHENNMKATVENLLACAKAHTPERGFKMYYTPDEQAFNAVRAGYPAETLALFDRWYSYQHIEKNPRTATAILTECRGHAVDKAFLDLALGRAASKGLVTFSKAPDNVGYQSGQYSGKDLRDSVPASEVYDCFGKKLIQTPHKLSQQAQAVLDAEAQRAAQRPDVQGTEYWKDQAERAAQANNFARKLELSRIVVTNPDRTINWELTAKERKENAGRRPFEVSMDLREQLALKHIMSP